VHNSSKSSTTNSLDTIAINEFTQLIGPIPPDDYIKSSGLTLSSISSGVGVNGVGTEVYKIDDGTAENSIGLTNGGDLIWLNQFTVAPGFQTITSIALAWGQVPTGLPTKLLVYEDPNDDGNPNDAVLLRQVDTTVANPDTNQFKTVTITPTTVSGSFFIAALLPNQQAGAFPAPIDQTAPKSNRSWIAGAGAGQFNINNLTANPLPPFLTEEIGLPGNWLLRADSQGQPQTSLAIAATNADQLEGNSGTKPFTFTVTRSGTTTGANNVNWAVTGSGTNPADAEDFFNGAVLPSGTVSFAAGETSKVITVNVQGDTTVEPDENFTVTLSNPTNGATITTATAIGTIRNDDNPNGGGGGTDIDGDGKGDILWRNKATGQNVVWYSGDGNNIKSLTTVTNLHWKMAGASDIDGDGKGDILWRNEATGQNTVWYGGDGNNIKSLIPVTNLHWKMAGGSDIDGDGKGDILWRNEATGQNTVWYGGDGNNIKSLTPVTNLNWKMAGGSDIDGDGKGDILWRNEATGQNVVWYGGESKNIASLTTVTNLNWEMIA
jgi:hypothetical protein